MSAKNRLGVAVGGVVLTLALAIPHGANAGPVEDGVNGVNDAVNDTVDTVSGGGGTAAPAPAPAPAPAAGIPPDYTPPLHGDNPHGQGTGATVDLTPSNTLPLSGDPAGGEGEDQEEIVVGRSRGEQDENGDYHGRIVIAALFGNEIVPGVETNEGEQDSGPLGPINEALCPLNGGGNEQLSLCLLAADSETTDNGSRNRFQAVGVNLGGETGISADAVSSEGNIEEDNECQTAEGSSQVVGASVGGELTADAARSSSTSTACSDGTETVEQDSEVISIADNGVPIPAPGCADGTPDSEFTPLNPLLSAVCNANDENGTQTDSPYGVREAFTVFVLNIIPDDMPLVKLTTAASESHAVAPEGNECPDPDNPDCPPKPECPDPDNPDCPPIDECPDPDNPDCPDGPPNGGPKGPGDDGPSAKKGPREELPFTGADLGVLGLIGALVMGAGLSLMALSDRRRRAERG